MTPSPSSDGTADRILLSPDGGSCYHGPTRAVFDERTTATETSRHNSLVPEVWVKRQLVAASANQRQLEMVNFLAGKLDFDGVDPELGM